ncbi:MAG: acetate kinase [Actinomycetia bacterium]|nr:acetate kinase [Actinomycetes bacterium]
MKILVINSGSSSLKYQLFDQDSLEVVDKGLVEKIGLADSFLKRGIGDNERELKLPLPDHFAAIQAVLDNLLDPANGLISSLDDIAAIGHRVVHGGEYFSASAVINDEVIRCIEECIPLAPLHNPPALTGIHACSQLIPNTVQVAVFDTSFHQSMAPVSYLYPLPYELYSTLKLRRYGFHGTSHRYVSQRAAEFLGKPAADLKLITCHIGNGCSVAAVKGGKSVDTSMGLTPLEGMMMGTRCGSIDPAIINFLMRSLSISSDEVDNLMNKKSGLLGISGISNDLRDVIAAADDGNERSQLAMEMYALSAKRIIGQYFFELDGADAVVMTAGVGENSHELRGMIFDGLAPLGLKLDAELNLKRGGERYISTDDSPVKLLVIPTNEELMIVKDVISLL